MKEGRTASAFACCTKQGERKDMKMGVCDTEKAVEKHVVLRVKQKRPEKSKYQDSTILPIHLAMREMLRPLPEGVDAYVSKLVLSRHCCTGQADEHYSFYPDSFLSSPSFSFLPHTFPFLLPACMAARTASPAPPCPLGQQMKQAAANKNCMLSSHF